MQQKTILLVEDSIQEALRYQKLLKKNYLVDVAHNLEDAKKLLISRHYFAIITDIHLDSRQFSSDYQGLELVKYSIEQAPESVIIVASADPQMNTYQKAIELGAKYFIKKPIISYDEFHIAIEEAWKIYRRDKARKNSISQDQETPNQFEDGLVLPQGVRQMINNIARSDDLPAVIYGETGTGKEEVAKLIHKKKELNQGPLPFVAINCANLSKTTALSQLFGHKKGSFTGATETTSGFIGDANGGTLFLDEIHRLNEECQAKLLRVLNDGSYERFGESKTLYSKFNIIVASSQDLDQMVETGEFLMDLRSRIIGVDIHLEPLRRRKEDLPDLIQLFMKKEGIMVSLTQIGEFVEECSKYYWQGNIRQLYNVLKSHTTMCRLNDQEIQVNGFPVLKTMLDPGRKRSDEPLDSPVKTGSSTQVNSIEEKILEALTKDLPFKESIELFEKAIIGAALDRHSNITKAVSALGMGRSSFDMKKKRYGL